MVLQLRRRVAVAAATLAGIPAAASEPQAAADVFAEWIALEQQIEQRRQEWKTEKAALAAEVALLEEQLRQTDLALAAEEERQATLSEERRNLEARHRTTAEGRAALEAALPGLRDSLQSLETSLPRSLRRDLQAEFAALDDSGAPLGAAYGRITGLLESLLSHSFTLRIVSEMRAFPGGETREVDTLYCGRAGAWYVDASGSLAGFGIPGPQGWRWIHRPEIAPEIARAIAMVRGTSAPALVTLPFRNPER